jgi:hypothetical protein
MWEVAPLYVLLAALVRTTSKGRQPGSAMSDSW